SVGIHLHKSAARCEPLNLLERRNEFSTLQIVDGVEREHRLEAVVGERQLDSISKMQASHHLGLAMRQGILGNIQAEGFQARQDFNEVLDQKSLAGTNVQYAVTRFEVEVLDDVLCDRNPAAIVAIAAIAVLARPVEVQLTVLP